MERNKEGIGKEKARLFHFLLFSFAFPQSHTQMFLFSSWWRCPIPSAFLPSQIHGQNPSPFAGGYEYHDYHTASPRARPSDSCPPTITSRCITLNSASQNTKFPFALDRAFPDCDLWAYLLRPPVHWKSGVGAGGGSGGAGFLTACRPVRNPYGIGTGAWEGREGLSAGCWLDLLELGEQVQGHKCSEVRYDSRLHRHTILDSAEEKGKGEKRGRQYSIYTGYHSTLITLNTYETAGLVSTHRGEERRDG